MEIKLNFKESLIILFCGIFFLAGLGLYFSEFSWGEVVGVILFTCCAITLFFVVNILLKKQGYIKKSGTARKKGIDLIGIGLTIIGIGVALNLALLQINLLWYGIFIGGGVPVFIGLYMLISGRDKE